MISPRFSACDRNEWTVARTSLVVRRLTRIVPATLVVGNPMPDTRSEPAAADAAFGAWANRRRPATPVSPGDIGAVDARLDEPQRHRAESGGEQRDSSEPDDRIRIGGHPEQDEPTLEQPAEALACAVDEQSRGEHQKDHAVGARDGDAATKDRSRLGPPTARVDRREACLGPPRHEEYTEADHRHAGDDDRDRQRRGPRQRAEADDPDRGADQAPARLCRQDPVDQVRPVELVGDPGDICAAREGPSQPP